MTIFEAYHQTLTLGKVDDFSIREWLRFLHGFPTMNDLVLSFQQPLKDELTYLKGIAELALGKPVAYLIQQTTFMGMTLYVDSRVLIPRPETEELILLTLKLMKRFHIPPVSILDLGTGSGAIALALKKLLPIASVMGVDLQASALEVAKKNGHNLQLDITWLQSDWFQRLPKNLTYDVMISNPPYIETEASIDSSVWQFEPHEALIANPPLKHYQTIMSQGMAYLKKPGLMVFEMSPELQSGLTNLIHDSPVVSEFGFEEDVNHKIRMVWILVK